MVEFGFQTRERTEESCPMEQVLCVGQRIENRHLLHLRFDCRFEPRKACWRFLADEFGQNRFAIFHAKRVVTRKRTICFLRNRCKPLTPLGHKCLRIGWYPCLLLISRSHLVGFVFGNKLLTVVGIFVAAFDGCISRLQIPHHLREYAKFKESPMDSAYRLVLRSSSD